MIIGTNHGRHPVEEIEKVGGRGGAEIWRAEMGRSGWKSRAWMSEALARHTSTPRNTKPGLLHLKEGLAAKKM